MVFPVTSSLAGPSGYPGPQAVVRRRFKDVVALADLLQVGGAREGGTQRRGRVVGGITSLKGPGGS